MAAYVDLYNLGAGNPDDSDDTLRSRVACALAVKAGLIIALTPPTAKQLTWAFQALDPDQIGSMAKEYLSYLLATNTSLTVAQLQSVTDTAIQTAVNAAVDKVTA